MATKYPAVVFVLLPLGFWLVVRSFREPLFRTRAVRPRRVPAKKLMMPALSFLLAAGVGCGLWFGKNWVLAGNPTYPLMYKVFGGKTWTQEKNDKWNRAHRPEWPDEFSLSKLAEGLSRVAWRSEWLSPLVIPLAAASLVPWWLRRQSRRQKKNAHHEQLANAPPIGFLVGYFVFIVIAWWALTHRIERFWIPGLPLVSLLAAAGAGWSNDRLWRRALPAFLAIGLVSNFLVAGFSRPGSYNRYFVGLERLRDHSERVDPWQRYFNHNCPDGRVLMVGVADVFDLEPAVTYNTVFDDCIFEDMVKGRTSSEVRRAFKARGVTHVFVHWGEIARYRSPGNYGFTDFVQPEVFERLVEERVLQQLPPIDGHPGQGYRVMEDGPP